MANTYTTGKDKIYFLNQNSIVQNLDADGILNPIPSLSLLNDVNSQILGKISGISSSISSLDVINTVSAGGYILQDLTQENGLITYHVRKLTSSDVENLEAYVSDSINALSIVEIVNGGNQIVDTITEANGIINVTFKDLSVDHVKGLRNELNELTSYDNKLCSEISSCAKTAEDTYFKKSGGTISGSVYIDSYNADNSLHFHQQYKTGRMDAPLYSDFAINEDGIQLSVGGTKYDGTTGRQIRLDAPSTENILINGTSLCSLISTDTTASQQNAKKYTDDQINGLSVEQIDFATTEVLQSISEQNGKIVVVKKTLSTDSIVGLGTFVDDKINANIQELCTTVDSRLSAQGKALSAYINERVATAYKPQGSVPTYDDLLAKSSEWNTDQLKSKHIGEVWNVIGSSHEDPTLSGQNYVWVFQTTSESPTLSVWGWDNIGGFTDFSKYSTTTEINELIATAKQTLSDDYVERDSSIYNSLTVQVSGNFSTLSTLALELRNDVNSVSTDLTSDEVQLDQIQQYVTALSVNDTIHGPIGIIAQLSNGISSLQVETVKTLKFTHHIDYLDGIKTKYVFSSLSNMFFELDLFDNDSSKIRNGAVIDVKLSNDTDTIMVENEAQTFKLGNGDVIIIHDHDNEPYVKLQSLNIARDTRNVYLLKAGVSRYEFEQEIEDRKEQIRYLSSQLSNDIYTVDVAYGEVKDISEISSCELYGKDHWNVGDIIIKRQHLYSDSSILSNEFQYTAYVHKNGAWHAMDGNYNAENIYFNKTFTLAGPYVNIGNLTKNSTSIVSSFTFEDNLVTLFDKMFAKRESPTITNNPTQQLTATCYSTGFNGVTLNSDIYREVGSKISVSLNVSVTRGTYTPWLIYDENNPNGFYRQNHTNVSAITWNVKDNKYDSNVTSSTYSADTRTSTQLTSNTTITASIKLPEITLLSTSNYTLTSIASYANTDFLNALDNLSGSTSIKVSNITNSSKSLNSVKPYYKTFYGVKYDKNQDMTQCDTAFIRNGLASTTSDYSNGGTLTCNIPHNAYRVVIAVPNHFAKNDPVSILDENDSKKNIRTSFTPGYGETPIYATVNDIGGNPVKYRIYYSDFSEPNTTVDNFIITF